VALAGEEEFPQNLNTEVLQASAYVEETEQKK